jgi:hypothetical protein
MLKTFGEDKFKRHRWRQDEYQAWNKTANSDHASKQYLFLLNTPRLIKVNQNIFLFYDKHVTAAI